MDKFLILSDGKPGHLNQSRAFCELTGHDYNLVEVAFRNRFCKVLSYLFDRIGLCTTALFKISGEMKNFSAVISAGSETYYANRTLASRLGARSISVMLPSGYRYSGFDLILGQEHDQPPIRDNIQTLPINLCKVSPKGIFQPEAGVKYIGLVIGGPNKAFKMDPERFRLQVKQIFDLFPEYSIIVATSRRTPPDIVEMLRTSAFTDSWIYSDDPVNPIPDFLAHCDYVFISADSTSMISEAVSFGDAAVEILPLIETGSAKKFNALVNGLQRRGCLHLFDGEVADCRTKIDLSSELAGVYE